MISLTVSPSLPKLPLPSSLSFSWLLHLYLTPSSLPSRALTQLGTCQECRLDPLQMYNNLRGTNNALIERNDVILIPGPLNLWHRWCVRSSRWHLEGWMVCIWVSVGDIGKKTLLRPNSVRLLFSVKLKWIWWEISALIFETTFHTAWAVWFWWFQNGFKFELRWKSITVCHLFQKANRSEEKANKRCLIYKKV